MSRYTATRHSQAGLTMVELMVAMVLGLILTGGVISLFVENKKSFNSDEHVARMHDEARFAIHELTRDVRMASFLAEPLAPGSVFHDASLDIGVDCGIAGQPEWMYSLTDAVTGEMNTVVSVDNATGPQAANAFQCIQPGEIVEGTDLVSVKRVGGDTVDVADLRDGQVYLRSNGTMGVMYLQPAAVTVPASLGDWPYQPRIYFIRRFTNEPGDGIPSLCRKVLERGQPPSMVTECIAEGIENLQIEYGLDTSGDGNANRYVPAPTLTEMQAVVSARIHLLARTSEPDRRYTDNRTYTVSNAPAATPRDNFHRRLYTVTVLIHNRMNQRRIGA